MIISNQRLIIITIITAITTSAIVAPMHEQPVRLSALIRSVEVQAAIFLSINPSPEMK